MQIIKGRNVNYTFPKGVSLLREEGVPHNTRGFSTIEHPDPVCTVYEKPQERVLFNEVRNSNYWFNTFEALWILGGRKDVAYLTQFNKRMADFSDNSQDYHGAYGYRLRVEGGFDQINEVIKLLKNDPDTRRAVLQIWFCNLDLNAKTVDLPCNDLIFLSIRNNKLNISVANRSNDLILGLAGTNCVQFSYLQEYIAAMVGCEIGTYRQVSNSCHVYTTDPHWERLKDTPEITEDPYSTGKVKPYPLISEPKTFDKELAIFLGGYLGDHWDNEFFAHVAIPMYKCWRAHKETKTGYMYLEDIRATDLRLACQQWLARRGDSRDQLDR